ncbi:hypothetical protein RYX36_023458 [Vicia faba]
MKRSLEVILESTELCSKKNPKVVKTSSSSRTLEQVPEVEAEVSASSEDPKWDEKGSVTQNYNSFGVVNDPNSLTDSLRAPPSVSDDPNDSGSDLEEDDLKSALGKRRRDGKSELPQPLTSIQGKRRRDCKRTDTKFSLQTMRELYGDEENNKKVVACLNVMATRVASVFASLRIAPLIHEWTYDAMCHDLLNMEGNKYVHEIPGKNGGQPERKEVLLEDHDPIWLELRYAHIADASVRLHEKMTNFISKNKAAQIQHGSRGSGEMSTRDLQKMVQALPQYSEQIDKLSLHVEVSS